MQWWLRLMVFGALVALTVISLAWTALLISGALPAVSVETVAAAEAIGAVFTALALLGAIWGFLHQSYIASDAADMNAIDRQLQVDMLFVEHPQMLPYFLDNKHLTIDDPNEEKVKAMANLLANYIDYYLTKSMERRLAFDHSQWQAYSKDLLTGSPALRKHIMTYSSWYCEDLLNVANAVQAQNASTASQ